MNLVTKGNLFEKVGLLVCDYVCLNIWHFRKIVESNKAYLYLVLYIAHIKYQIFQKKSGISVIIFRHLVEHFWNSERK